MEIKIKHLNNFNKKHIKNNNHKDKVNLRNIGNLC